MDGKDRLRVKRFKKAFKDIESISDLTDEEIIIRLNAEKAYYRKMNSIMQKRIDVAPAFNL